MERIRLSLLRYEWFDIVFPLVVLAITLAVGYGAKKLLFRGLRRWSAHSKGHMPATLTEALEGPFMIWVLILGLYFGTQSIDAPDRVLSRISQALAVLFIISMTMMGSRLAGNIIKFYGSAIPGAMPVTSLTQNLAQLVIVILGILLILTSLKISITPILTALGVGGLAVALALQDTLSNLFAGFYVAIARQVRLGDYIKLNTGEEGYVTDITWRSTMIRALGNNLIIIPNAKLAQAIVTNYCLPEKRLSASIQVGVAYDSDPEKVERLLLEIGQEGAAQIPGLLAEPAPSVRFLPGFGESAMQFTLGFQVSEFVDQFLVQHELGKRILARFRQEGIQIAYPTRTVHLENSAAAGT
jgi:small-conductance mechanosensitive channel